MNLHTIRLNSLEETSEFGRRMAEYLPPGILVGLSGALGVGKTAFVSAVAKGLGVQGSVCSPTFVIEHQYPLAEDIFLSHWDLYRLNSSEMYFELAELKMSLRALVFIEWPERAEEVVRLLDIHISLEFLPTENDAEPARMLSLTAKSPLGEGIISKLA